MRSSPDRSSMRRPYDVSVALLPSWIRDHAIPNMSGRCRSPRRCQVFALPPLQLLLISPLAVGDEDFKKEIRLSVVGDAGSRGSTDVGTPVAISVHSISRQSDCGGRQAQSCLRSAIRMCAQLLMQALRGWRGWRGSNPGWIRACG